MKTSRIYLGMAAALIAGSLTFTSCHKKEKTQPQEPDTEQGTAADNNLAENHANDIDAIGSQACEAGSLSTFRVDGATTIDLVPCAVITGVGTKTITVDFGTTGCVGTDGKTRTGKLFFDLSGCTPTTAVHYRNPGFKMVVTGQNYTVDGNQINNINKTVINTTSPTAPAGTNLTWSINASLSIIKAGNGGTITWNCSRTKELTNSYYPIYSGQTTAIDWTQAIIRLNGSANGTNAKGESYTATAHDLVRDFNCHPDVAHPHRHPFVSGTISYTPGNRPNRLIDFGNGACDLNATVTINGQTWAVTLP